MDILDAIDTIYYFLMAGIIPFALLGAGLTAFAAAIGIVVLFLGRSYLAGLCEYR